MSKKLKIFVWGSTFLLLMVIGVYSPLLKQFGYYNISIQEKNDIVFQIGFGDDLEQGTDSVLMSITSIDKGSVHFSKDSTAVAILNKDDLKFNFISGSIPTFFNLNFPESKRLQIKIDHLVMVFNGREIDLPLSNFIVGESIQMFEKSTILNVDPAKDHGYTPYKYRLPKLYFHKLKWTEIILLGSIAVLLSYMITLLVELIMDKTLQSHFKRNSVLIYLVCVSLLFHEHWSSKVLIVVGLFLVYDVLIKKNVIKRIQFGSFILFFIIGILSLIWSVDVQNSLIVLVRLIPLILVPVWLSQTNENIDFKRTFRWVSLTYVLFGLASIFLASLKYYTTLDIGEFFYHTLLLPFGEANAIYVALLYSMIFLVNISLIQFSKSNILDFLILVLLMIYIIMLSSKMISLTVLLSSFVIVFGKYKDRFKTGKSLFGFISVALVLALFALSSSKKLQSRYMDVMDLEGVTEALHKEQFGPVYPWNGLNLRIFQLRCFWEIEKNSEFNSILGVGLNNGQVLLDERYDFYGLYKGKDLDVRGGYYVFNFHNQYAQTLIEMGVIGFFGLIFIFVQLFSFAIRNKSYLMFAVGLLLFCILLSESLLLRSKGIIIFVLFPMLVYQMHSQVSLKK